MHNPSSFFAIETGPIMRTNMISKGVFTMRKALLVIMIGMVLVMNIYGIIGEIMAKIEVKNEHQTVVYVE